jgi:hypothetical protein
MSEFQTTAELEEEQLKRRIGLYQTGGGNTRQLSDSQFLRWVGNRFVHTYQYSVNDPMVSRLFRIADYMEGK